MYRARRSMTLMTVALAALCTTATLTSAAPAQAQPNRYAEDLERLKKVIAFGQSALGYFHGFLGAIAWLTGLEDGSGAPSIDDIRETVVEALREQQTGTLLSRVATLTSDLREIRSEARSRAQFLMSQGLGPEDLMRDPAGQAFLISHMQQLVDDSNEVLHEMYPIVQRPADVSKAGYNPEKQLVAVMPAFLALVPLRAAALKMVGELIPSLAQGMTENALHMFHDSGEALYRAVGTYAIGHDFERDPWPLLSPVGLQHSFMFKRQLFSYYHRVPGGGRFGGPIMRFSQYQNVPLVDAALTILESLRVAVFLPTEGGLTKIDEESVWMYDLFRNPNDPRTSPQFRSVSDGRIVHVRACSPHGEEYNPAVHPAWTTVCPRIPSEGN